MTVNFTYGWRVEGERVVASDIRSEIKAADGNAATGFMAGLTQMAANTFANRGKPGTVNVLRLNDRELVMRDTETPQAPLIGCTRAAAPPPDRRTSSGRTGPRAIVRPRVA
jgi:hypothetical protein